MAANPIVLDIPAPLARPRGRAEAGLSIVVPVYNEAGNLPGLHARIVEVATALHNKRRLVTEVIYIDDGSRDDTLAVARTLPADALDVQVISLSRNFGKEAALLAGLDHARLGAVLFMDGDGQHPPSLVDTLVGHWLDGGYDVVYTAKAHRENEPLLRRLSVHGRSTWNFYSLLGLSIEGLTSFSVAPLRLASLLGLLLAGAALVFGLQILIETFFFGQSVPGYPSLVVGLMVLGGVQLIMIGIMGEYIGKILSELKARPVYFVAEHAIKSAEGSNRAAGEPRSAAE
jgi:cellulose synthase/poly-beta-1,6-N-acetylglucosamine synthase-like glycosyltransferase